MCSPHLDAPFRELSNGGLGFFVSTSNFWQIDFLCSCTRQPIQLYSFLSPVIDTIVSRKTIVQKNSHTNSPVLINTSLQLASYSPTQNINQTPGNTVPTLAEPELLPTAPSRNHLCH